jgi:hypothetical protein
MRAAAALPALFSSIKLIVEFTTSKTIIPRKSSQSGGMPCRCVSQSELKCRGQGKTQIKNEQRKNNIAEQRSTKQITELSILVHWPTQ